MMHVNSHALTFCQMSTVMHYLVSTLYVYSILLDAVSDYHVTTPWTPTRQHPSRGDCGH